MSAQGGSQGPTASSGRESERHPMRRRSRRQQRTTFFLTYSGPGFEPLTLRLCVKSGNTKGGSINFTVPLTSCFDWFGLVCFANKNKNCQLSYS